MFSINPATGRRLRSYRRSGAAEIDAALGRAQAAFLEWRLSSPAERSRFLRALAVALRKGADELAALATAEMGKPIGQASAEVEKSAITCEFYARRAARFLAPETPEGSQPNSRVEFEPLGPVLAVMPWNFPIWQVLRAAVPAIAAGNSMVLKHASNVPGCALAIERVFRSAGAPRGLFQALLAPSSRVPSLVADRRIRAITLTGSTEAGRQVAALAGSVLKKGVYELGGSDPYVVLEDADLDLAAETCAQSRLINSGQSCVNAKRFVVVSSVLRDFEGKFAARLAARKVGDPMDPSVEVGPLARRDLRDKLASQVRKSIQAGARLVLGGSALPGPGFFYAPTLLTDVRPGQPAYGEELFGPVAALIPARDEKAAVAIANDSPFGLGAGVFTRSRIRAARVARLLESGNVAINDFVRSDPALPFGGSKESGYGRELGSFGIREFTNIKTICG